MNLNRRFFLLLASVFGLKAAGCKRSTPVVPAIDLHDVVDSEYGLTRIHVAAREGDLEGLRSLLANGGDPNIVDTIGNGKSPLHWALNSEIVDLLVQNGADTEYRGSIGQSPLGSLAMRNRHSAVSRLIDLGVSVDEADNIGSTPLLWCIAGLALGLPDDSLHEDKQLRLKTIKLLVDNGANVNHKNDLGSTALGGAVKFAPEYVPYLLQVGADPNVPDSGKTLLEWAVERDDSVTAELIQSALDANRKSPDNKSLNQSGGGSDF